MTLLKRVKEKQHGSVAETQVPNADAEPERHPILALGADRNVREAYFHGLVFAAFANDDKIDEKENAWLSNLGRSLGFVGKDVTNAVACVGAADDAGKMSLIEECARQIADSKIAECFLSDFSTVWALGGGSPSEYEEFRKQLIAWMGVEIGEKSASPETRRNASAENDKPSNPVKNLSERDKLLNTLNRIADDYSSSRTISLSALKAISRRMGRFDAERINWPGAVNAILKEVK